ncbi:MAG: GNAT family N-acetyltransferase [Christensenellaceae bacterium]|jgi:L-amino acid N-acyltransferase YncA
MNIREYTEGDLPEMIEIWNAIVCEGVAFPQTDPLTVQSARAFFGGQTYTGVVHNDGEILGLYILHPNNVGRCGHIANASYAVKEGQRGKHIGEKLVRHSLQMGREKGFRILQFNAVVVSNTGAIHLYEKLGFRKIGIVENGFLMKDGSYSDIMLFYIPLAD